MLSMIDDIRNRYPNPIAGRKAQYPYTQDEYCCGGAYCRYLGYTIMDMGFPMVHELARILRKQNPELCCNDAHTFASAIIDYNDAERFEEAWQLLAQVLPYVPQVAE